MRHFVLLVYTVSDASISIATARGVVENVTGLGAAMAITAGAESQVRRVFDALSASDTLDK
jgi:hypothetical protein